MPVAKLKKAVLYYHKSIQDDVLLTLQKSGVCEIIPENAETDDSFAVANESKTKAAVRVTKCDAILADLRFLMRFLEVYYKDPVSSMARALGERPSNSMRELAEMAACADIAEKLEIVRSFERKLSSIRIEMSQLDNTKTILDNLSGFPYEVNIFGSKGRLRAVAGSLPFMQSEPWKESLLKEIGTDCEIYLAPPKIKERDIWGVVMYASERESEVMEICLKNNFTESELDFSKEEKQISVSAQLEFIKQRQNKLHSEEKNIHDEISKYALLNVPVLRKLVDHWSIQRERSQAFASGEFTDSAVVTSFWIPESDLPDVEAKLSSLGICELIATDPGKEDDAPSLMRNTKWNSPFVSLTTLYSSPQYGTVDPTPKLAPFFFIFFGMCFGDAGYALLLALTLWFVLRKYRNMSAALKDFLMLFMFVSGAAFIYGAITGSIFGDLFAVVPFLKPLDTVRNALILFDPMKDLMFVLGISLVLGIIHLFYGMIIAFKVCWEEENYADALFDKAAWLFFITSLLFIGAVSAGVISHGWMGVAQAMAVLGALIIGWYAGIEKKGIFSKIISGVLSLYAATSWLGDILSYSRLLALGLASAAIATVFNMLGDLASDIPYVGWLVATLIVVGGHIFNLVIGILGAFVHSLRLQYVEFFGKFYTGGGREFKPLSCNTKYVNISEK